MVSSSLLGTIARLHDEKRGDPRSAIETYERLAQHDPEDQSPLDALEGLHTMVGDWRGMVDVLQRKVARSYDPIERGVEIDLPACVREHDRTHVAALGDHRPAAGDLPLQIAHRGAHERQRRDGGDL